MRRKESSRDRLLAAGKHLFATRGYEQTSTETVAHRARTSEAQLVRHFGGKAGLLAAIFEEAWIPLNSAVQKAVAQASTARDGIMGILSTMAEAFAADPDLAILFLFEGRRRREGGGRIRLSHGYSAFFAGLFPLLDRGQRDGSLSVELDKTAAVAAFLGAAEGMIREQVIARMDGKRVPFSAREMRQVFATMLNGFAPTLGNRVDRGFIVEVGPKTSTVR